VRYNASVPTALNLTNEVIVKHIHAREEGFRSGFVAIIGRPNVGKSTLLNLMLKEKVAIVSDKPQTTRNEIRGILTEKEFQIVFLDTPGIHKAKDEINRFMVQKALATFNEVDLILFVVEPADQLGKGDQYIGNILQDLKTPVFLLINKIDLVSEDSVEHQIELYKERFQNWKIIPISALTGSGAQGLVKLIVENLPEGHPFFPDDQFTDQPLRALCAELIREKVFECLGEEVPYAVAVEVTAFREDAKEPSGLVVIEATVHVERSSQKGILIGKKGQMLKKIGTAARQDMEALLGTKVYLNLWVKVTKGWRNDPKSLRRFGYQ